MLGDDVHDLPSSRIDYQDFVVPLFDVLEVLQQADLILNLDRHRIEHDRIGNDLSDGELLIVRERLRTLADDFVVNYLFV